MSAGDPADPVAAVAALLAADAGVAPMAEGRVFGGELPASETQFMPRYALVAALSGGVSLTGNSYVEHDTVRIDVLAWAPTPQGASALLAAASLALRRVNRTVSQGVLLHWAQIASAPIAGRDGDTQWPFSFQSFQVFHALESVA